MDESEIHSIAKPGLQQVTAADKSFVVNNGCREDAAWRRQARWLQTGDGLPAST